MKARVKRGLNGLLARTVDRYLERWQRRSFVVFGDRDRLHAHPTARLYGAHFNTIGGSIIIEENVLFGPGAVIVTGTHDITKFGAARQKAATTSGRDVYIEQGAWIAAGAVIVGPCRIGKNAVVAAGAVVLKDVTENVVVAGVPARPLRNVTDRTHRIPPPPADATPRV